MFVIMFMLALKEANDSSSGVYPYSFNKMPFESNEISETSLSLIVIKGLF